MKGMAALSQATRFRFWLWVISFLGVIVPRRIRPDWRQEWLAELQYREELLSDWQNLNWKTKTDLLWHSLGAFCDAIWLQSHRWEDEMIQDLRYGVRMLVKTPGFTIIAVVTLALGIGANTAIFSVVNAVLLRPLPYPEPQQLVMLEEMERDGTSGLTTFATFSDWRERSKSFGSMSLVRYWEVTLTGDSEPELLPGMRVSANFFTTLGVKPALGREFLETEDHPDTRYVVMLSHEIWKRRFQSDPNIVGRPISLSGISFTVVGVMPQDFDELLSARLYSPAALWAPIGYEATQPWACRTCHHVQALARLKQEVGIDQAKAEMDAISASLFSEHPRDYSTSGVAVIPLQKKFFGQVQTALAVLLGAVGLVLLIACSNVANLLLARSSARAGEFAIRAALGASRRRILRQLLTESLLLTLAGALIGLLLAKWSLGLIVAISPATILRLHEVGIDGSVLGFTLLVSVAAALFFGLVPALSASRMDLNVSLKERGRGVAFLSHGRMRSALVIGEVALSLALLIAAGLLVKSFFRLVRVTPGFDPDNLLTLHVSASGPRYENEDSVRAFFDEAISRVQALPGVESVGIVSNLPLDSNRDGFGFHIEGRPSPNPADAPSAERYVITPDYLKTMRIPVKRGRGFTSEDRPQSLQVVLVNETAVRRCWPDEEPLGKRIRLGGPDNPIRTIVGIVGDVNHDGLDKAPEMQAYVPQTQWTNSLVQFVIRTSGDPQAVVNPVCREIWSVDKDQPIYRIATMGDLVSTSVAQRRFTLILIGFFAVIALLLAAVGIYGVMSQLVAQRTHEVGIRMALGAQTGDVLKLVIGEGMRLALIGLAIGLSASLALSRWLKDLLFAVEPTDPVTFSAIVFLLMVAALLACYLPARRAAKIDPLSALRHE
jgi:putative ABC transport system permease protein